MGGWGGASLRHAHYANSCEYGKPAFAHAYFSGCVGVPVGVLSKPPQKVPLKVCPRVYVYIDIHKHASDPNLEANPF